MRKLSVFFRKIHRYLTIPFIILTLAVMVFTKGMPVNEILFRWQRILMLGLAVTGAYMFFYTYWIKWTKKRK